MTQCAEKTPTTTLQGMSKREASRAEALRENLRKRKAQQQLRSTASKKPSKE